MAREHSAHEKVLEAARRRFKAAAEAESEQRQRMLEDKQFRAGRQWPDDVQAQRTIDKRPCLTIDKLSGPIRQVTNAQRQSRFAIDIVPQGDAAVETAEIFQGLVRHIEVESTAQVAYAWAFEDAVTCGCGWWRVLTDYAGDESFDQELRIKRIRNPFTVYLDPSAHEPDASDARYAFITEDVPADEFKERWPKAEGASSSSFESLGDEASMWIGEDTVKVAEYWWREPVTRTMAQLADGQVVELDTREAQDVAGVPVLDRRDVDAWRVHWALITGVEVLDQRVWPGKYIPLVPVVGEELDLGGERILRGLVRSARDAQRMYNYWVSAETEAIALAPRAPFIGAEGQFEGHEAKWKLSNLSAFPYLEYVPKTVGGAVLGPPQRQIAEPPIQALVMAVQQADNDIKATTGLFDPSLGNINSRERSGKAIQALQRQGETVNSNYVDNLARAITHTGRILVDLIPYIYDRPGRIVRILGADDQAQSVALNAPYVPGPEGQPQVVRPGTPGAKVHDLRQGRYAVRVQVGASYTTRRQETSGALLEIAGGSPGLLPMIGDLLFKEMDWPGAAALSERFKKMLPPPLQDDQAGGQVPPQVQAQLAQAGQMVEALTQRVNELTDAIETEAVKAKADAELKRMELESRERIAALQVQADLVKTEAQINAKNAQVLIQGQLEDIRRLLEMQHERETGAEQRAWEGEQADQERLYGAMTLGAEQTHASRESEAERAAQAAQEARGASSKQ